MQARHTTFALSCLLLAAPVLAQDPPKMSPEELAAMQAYQQAGTPGPQHAGLALTAGEYTVTIKSWNAPGAPPTESTGSAIADLAWRALACQSLRAASTSASPMRACAW